MRKSISLTYIFLLWNCSMVTTDTSCRNWESYKDEKCFKIIDKVVIKEEAEKICEQQEIKATLLTINSKEEQEFLTNLLFKTHKIVDGVWIGAKFIKNKFQWSDETDFHYSNWVSGSPSNKTDKECAQIIPEGPTTGQWIDESCNKSNKVVCQIQQNWPFVVMQKTVMDVRKELLDNKEFFTKQIANQQLLINSQKTIIENLIQNLTKEITDRQTMINNQHTLINNLKENITKQFSAQESSINNHQITINSLNANQIPINYIYTQLPNQAEPKSLWPNFEWKDITSEYAGLFFRAQGGKSLKFGEVQNENSPRLIKVHYGDVNCFENSDLNPGSWSRPVCLAHEIQIGHSISISFLVSDAEVVPRNMAMRFWKRSK